MTAAQRHIAIVCFLLGAALAQLARASAAIERQRRDMAFLLITIDEHDPAAAKSRAYDPLGQFQAKAPEPPSEG